MSESPGCVTYVYASVFFTASEMIPVCNILEYFVQLKLKSTNLESEGALSYHLSPQSNLYYFSKEPNSMICARMKMAHGQIVLRNCPLLGGSQHPLAF